ncbi:MAG: hypothetical protein K1X57_11160 [Gemmataceae bacterium]|nr:hypothetical protein [Gemmataceae bacterium]
MGMEIEVRCAALPDWATLAARLRAAGLAPALRMIDGMPAFPDEEPPAEWQELRVTLPAGMVTIRRMPDGVRLVTWGDVGADMIAQRDTLAVAILGESK